MKEDKNGSKTVFAADELTAEDDHGVVPLAYDIDKDNYSTFMDEFIRLVDRNMGKGYMRINVMASTRTWKVISILVRKQTMYNVAIRDDEKLYEVGYKSYEERFGDEGVLYGKELSHGIFRDKIMDIVFFKVRMAKDEYVFLEGDDW
ncbi:hypothetical protein CTI12_AA360680 [Artemisia annua]|uniref:Uncharacterized protein n=1 Tax=Artemisia annua TaxID=35608 RepID=A0A2U1MNF8_ARTAN|nr:hypothetical protein CTI12_AA360680 [Artemisia annua]